MTDTITLPRATVVQALETLLEGLYTGKKERFEIALRTLSAALVQPEQQAEPVADGDKVICPACCHQFRGIPETVQTLMLHAGFEPPFTTPPQQQSEPDRRPLQAEGKHPAPCARHCEAKAFEIEIRSLKSALKHWYSMSKQQAKPVAWAWETSHELAPQDAFSWVQTAIHKMPLYTTPPKQQAEPVSQAVIAGALFDFMGWLTTRDERLVLSGADEAGPAVEAITAFSKMRGLSLDDAKVQDWQNYTTSPRRKELFASEILNMMPSTIPAEYDGPLMEFARAVEAKLKERNK